MSDMCPVHNVAWKTVPAGISKKSGKPYNAFQACPERGCNERPDGPAWKSAPRTAPSANPQVYEELTKQTKLLGQILACLLPKDAKQAPVAPTQKEGEINVDDIPF